jgi:hypothetical protein
MRVIGLFLVVFACLYINKLLGFPPESSFVGALVGACSYVLLTMKS